MTGTFKMSEGGCLAKTSIGYMYFLSIQGVTRMEDNTLIDPRRCMLLTREPTDFVAVNFPVDSRTEEFNAIMVTGIEWILMVPDEDAEIIWGDR